jgi:hypothetical protein
VSQREAGAIDGKPLGKGAQVPPHRCKAGWWSHADITQQGLLGRRCAALGKNVSSPPKERSRRGRIDWLIRLSLRGRYAVPGRHGSAYSALDSVRAVHQLRDLSLSDQTVV